MNTGVSDDPHFERPDAFPRAGRGNGANVPVALSEDNAGSAPYRVNPPVMPTPGPDPGLDMPRRTGLHPGGASVPGASADLTERGETERAS